MKRPSVKDFQSSKYVKMIGDLSVNMSELEFERVSEIVVYDILMNYEGFNNVEKGPDFRGTPFDFLGIKMTCPISLSTKVH
jgi:hypothetical protein